MSYSDGIDKGVIKHFLSFDSDTTGRVEIAEPVGFDGADLETKQDTGRYGRDVSFAGGEIEYSFYANTDFRGLTHQFEKLLEYDATYGFESDVKYIIEYDGVDYIIGELDFQNKTTDGIFKFTCKVIQDILQAKIKRHKTTNVDVFSDTDIQGEAITPLSPELVVFKATPLKLISQWKIPNAIPSTEGFSVVGTTRVYLSLTQAIISSEIDGTLVPDRIFSSFESEVVNAKFINSANTLNNVKVSLSDFTYNFTAKLATNGSNANITTRVFYRVGLEIDDARISNSFDIPNSGTNANYDLPILNIEREENLWIYLQLQTITGDNLLYTIEVPSFEINVIATSQAIDSVTESVRVIDVMKQVVNSIAGVSVQAPQFEVGGSLYNNFLVNGNQLRNIDNRAFNFTFDDILKGIKEVDADYQIMPNNTVYFGTRDTFYKQDLLATFEGRPNEAFNQSYNPRATINTFDIKFNHYEQGQNDDLENSREGIHTEAQYNLPNQRVENKKEIALPWGRDPFEIEKVRRQGLQVPESTSQEDDETVFIVEVIEKEGAISRSESFLLSHIITSTSILELVNQGEFNWSISGIQVNDVVTITGSNAGSYIVGSIGQANLQLLPISPTPNPTFTGIEFTEISYNITATNLVSATNEGFAQVIGSTEPEGFANMRYSIARTVRRFFGTYLKMATSFYPQGSITNTKFIYNRDFSTRRDSETTVLVEGSDISISSLPNAILSPEITETEVPCTFVKYRDLVDDLRVRMGYIEVENNKGDFIKVHPQELIFDWTANLLKIKGENRA